MLTGAFDNISVVVRHTLVQMLTPDHMRGRVSAVNNVFIGASNELGSLAIGSHRMVRRAGIICSRRGGRGYTCRRGGGAGLAPGCAGSAHCRMPDRKRVWN